MNYRYILIKEYPLNSDDKGLSTLLAGVARFELANVAVKALCLTPWLHPIKERGKVCLTGIVNVRAPSDDPLRLSRNSMSEVRIALKSDLLQREAAIRHNSLILLHVSEHDVFQTFLSVIIDP